MPIPTYLLKVVVAKVDVPETSNKPVTATLVEVTFVIMVLPKLVRPDTLRFVVVAFMPSKSVNCKRLVKKLVDVTFVMVVPARLVMPLTYKFVVVTFPKVVPPDTMKLPKIVEVEEVALTLSEPLDKIPPTPTLRLLRTLKLLPISIFSQTVKSLVDILPIEAA